MKKYVFKPYSKKFPELFDRERKRITSHIKNQVIIEHVGSTAIPNLGGKGIIDIAIVVSKEEIDSVLEQLQELDYEFRLVHSTPERLFLRADLPDPDEGVRRYHIHLMHSDSREGKDMIAFRDYLREHPDEAKNYADLKKKAAEEVNEDGAKYRELKEPVFKKILKKREEDGTR